MAVTVQVRERVGFHRDVYNSLVKCLIRQRKTGEFCDVVLRVNSRRYYAHRAVLAAASPYFRSMFTASMKEQESTEVDLSQSVLIDADDSFKRVLDFMYCGDIEINVENVEDVLRIADFLLFDDVKDYCRQFFLAHGNLTLSNCLWVSVLAEHHSLHDVADVARAMVRCRFHDYFIVSADELVDLPAPVLAGLFADADVMRFVSAEQLIGALLRWVQHDLASRQVQLRWLLEVVAGHQTDMTELLSDASSAPDLVKQLSAAVDVMTDASSTGKYSICCYYCIKYRQIRSTDVVLKTRPWPRGRPNCYVLGLGTYGLGLGKLAFDLKVQALALALVLGAALTIFWCLPEDNKLIIVIITN